MYESEVSAPTLSPRSGPGLRSPEPHFVAPYCNEVGPATLVDFVPKFNDFFDDSLLVRIRCTNRKSRHLLSPPAPGQGFAPLSRTSSPRTAMRSGQPLL